MKSEAGEYIQKPTPGRIVWYQTDGRNYDYYVPAIIRITVDNLVPEAVEDGVIEDLSSPTHVHLRVTGGREPYNEFDVPFSSDAARRTWRYPEHTNEVVEVPS